MAVIRAKRKSQGGGKCCLFGCLTVFVLLLAVVGIVVWGGMYALDKAKEYADTKPLDLPQVEMPEAEREQVIARFNEFREALQQQQPATLELTDQEINALFQYHPDLAEAPQLRNTYTRIDDGIAKVLGSYQLTKEGDPEPLFLNFVLTLEPADNPQSFFQFNATRVTFPAENLTPEQKADAQKFVTDFVQGAGDSMAQNLEGQAMLSGDRLIIVTGSQAAEPEATAPTVPEEQPAETENLEPAP